MTDMFHLGWFLNFVADEWNGNWGDGGVTSPGTSTSKWPKIWSAPSSTTS